MATSVTTCFVPAATTAAVAVIASILWNFDTHYRSIGSWGGGGMGYGPPASVGTALANKKYERFSVAIQGDGDFMYSPGALWTAAHHQIPSFW